MSAKPTYVEAGAAGSSCATGFNVFAGGGMGASAPEGEEETVLVFVDAEPDTENTEISSFAPEKLTP